MRRVAPTGPRIAHAVALAAATAALAFTLAGPGALLGPLALVVIAMLLLPHVEWPAVPAGLVRVLPRAVALLLVATGFVAWLSRAMGALLLEPSLLPRVAGPLLLAAAVLFALAPRLFPAGRTLLPAIVGLLAVAGLDPRPAGYGGTALAFLRGSEHTAFAERYLALAIVVMAALWTAAVLERGPRLSRRSATALALSVALAAFAAASGVIGLPLFQPHVERAFASAFADGATGLGGESKLGEFAALAVSRRRVLDLQTSLPAGGAWRLPSEVFTRFDGRGWAHPSAPGTPAGGSRRRLVTLRPLPAPPGNRPLLEGLGAWFAPGPVGAVDAGDALDAAGAVELRVTQAEVRDWPLLAPRGTQAVTAGAHLLHLDRHGLVRRPAGDALRLYGLLWSPTPSTTPPPLAPDERAEALALPPHVDARLSALARRLAGSEADDARARLEAVVSHLQTGYRYTLAPGGFRTDDPLAEFLFEKKAGYCEYFATAAVLLLRLQGVPARYVKGLALGPQTDQGAGLHVVRESDAHAWLEAYVPGEGWVEADPTPPGDLAASRPRSAAWSRLAEHVRAALASAWARVSLRGPGAFARWLAGRVRAGLARLPREPLAWLALAAVGLGLLVRRALAARLRRRLRAAPPRDDHAVPADLRALVRALERGWAAAACPRPAGRGLLEHARQLAASTSTPRPLAPGLAAAGPRIVETYYGARFAGRTVSPAEVADLRQALRSG